MDIGKDEPVSHIYDVGIELQDIGLEDQGQVPVSPSSDIEKDESMPHDQLPNVEEYKMSQQIGGSSRASIKASLAIALMIILASVLITVGVVVGKNSEAPASATNETLFTKPNYPEPVTRTRGDDVINFVINMGWANYNDINNQDSPQYKAAMWLANNDHMTLPIEVSEEFMNRYLLATIFYALDGEHWQYDLNWLTGGSVCDWNTYFATKKGTQVSMQIQIGVSCRDGTSVKELYLPNVGLRGSLPAEIGFLYDLENINFSSNKITSALPDTMKNLQGIISLVLNDNQFNGPIPDWIGRWTHLATLNLARNSFDSALPPTLSNLKELQTLALETNHFIGDLEPLLGLSNLVGLYLGNNEFYGNLRDEIFSSWQVIEVMDMSNNTLTGNLPKMLLAKNKLLVVDLHTNHFNGPLPTIIGVEGSIEFLALYDNQLNGPIDDRFLSLTKLAHLDLSKNFFTGDMPTHLGNLKSLKYLYLAFNPNFNLGRIPSEYGDLPNLVDLSLQKTNRNGRIPYHYENLKELVLLDLDSNKLTGPVPSEIGSLTNLRFLLLKENLLTGTLPITFAKLKQLDTILLDDNAITAGSESICKPKLPLLTTFIADCSKMHACECCTKCCSASDLTCNNVTWFSEVDPIAQDAYNSQNYAFHENDIIYPAPTDSRSDPSYYQNFTGYYNTPP